MVSAAARACIVFLLRVLGRLVCFVAIGNVGYLLERNKGVKIKVVERLVIGGGVGDIFIGVGT